MQRLYERAENETRTRDPNLGKVVLYQLSYFRLLNSAAKIHFFLISPSLSKKKFSFTFYREFFISLAAQIFRQ